MKKALQLAIILTIVAILTACGSNETDTADELELVPLEVDFIVPETAEVGENVKLEAIVTYGEEAVTDAKEVQFEIWEVGKEDESDKIDGKHEGEGVYTIDYTFEEEAVYEMYAHTTAHDLHTMPKKSVTVGDPEVTTDASEDVHAFHTEGFDLHFNEPEQVKATEETDLVTHITLEEEPLESAKVRYEIIFDEDENQTTWVDATETAAGEYSATHAFAESGPYAIQVHVEDDADLHEHQIFAIDVQ